LLTDDGHVKVADFGIALTLDGTSLTRTGTVMGSAPYVSPEQVLGETAGPASDMYALGIVLYEMLAGHTPFTGEAPLAVAYKHLHERPRSLREVRRDVSAATATLVDRLLAKDPQKRYPSAAALAAELHRLAGARASAPVSRTRATEPRPGKAHSVFDATAKLRPAADATARLDAAGPAVDRTAKLPRRPPAAAAPILRNGPAAASAAPVRSRDETAELPAGGGQARGRAASQPVAKTSALAVLPARRDEAVSETARLRRSGSGSRAVSAVRITVAAVVVFFGLAFLAAAYRAAWTAAHVRTPNLVGHTVADAGKTVGTLSLGVLVSGKRQDPTAPFGVVLAQDPPPGLDVAKGTVINLTVSEGSGIVPDLGGQSVQSASSMLERVGLRLGRVSYAINFQVETGRIMYQFQPAGMRVQPNGGVDVIVSQGLPKLPFLFPQNGPNRGHGGPHAPKEPSDHEHGD
jgi:serine/threonine-protein kinase